jgi:hypothetical protein
VAKRWLDRAGGRKTARRALGNGHVAKFQFQLPSIFLGSSQLFNPRLYLLYRIKDGAIEDFNIAFPSDVGFRVAQDALHDFVLGSDS